MKNSFAFLSTFKSKQYFKKKSKPKLQTIKISLKHPLVLEKLVVGLLQLPQRREHYNTEGRIRETDLLPPHHLLHPLPLHHLRQSLGGLHPAHQERDLVLTRGETRTDNQIVDATIDNIIQSNEDYIRLY